MCTGPIKKFTSATVLELCAIHLALLHFHDQFSQSNVYIYIYIYEQITLQGGYELPERHQSQEATAGVNYPYFLGRITFGLSQSRTHQHGRKCSSRLAQLPQEEFQSLVLHSILPYVDVCASPMEAKTSRSFLRYQCQQAEQILLAIVPLWSPHTFDSKDSEQNRRRQN